MSYARPSGQGITVKGPEIEEVYRAGKPVSLANVWTYEGTQEEIDAQRYIERVNGATRINSGPSGNGGLYRLTSSFPFDFEAGGEDAEEPQDLHEIEVQVEQIPVWNSEHLRTQFSGTTAQVNKDIAIVKVFFDRFQSGDFKDANGLADIEDAVTKLKTLTNDDTKSEALFRRVAAGTESALEYREVYRRTITAVSYNQVQASYEGVGKIWTSAEVEGSEGVPTSEWFGLRSGMQWLKANPTVQAAAGGKTQIQYFYTEFKQATSLLYAAYGSATLLD